MNVLKLTSAAVALASLALGGSCADQEESIIIAGAPAWQGSCSVSVPASVFLAQGLLDVRFETGYMLPLEIQNQLIGQMGDSVNSGIDNSELQLVGVDVTLTSQQRPQLLDALPEDFVDFSPPIPTNSLSGGGSLGFLVNVIPDATTTEIARDRVERATQAGVDAQEDLRLEVENPTEAELESARLSAEVGVLSQRETIVATVVVRARRTGNAVGTVGEIEAREFKFPIEVCHGCTITCATCEYEVDSDADGEADDTISGVCPPGSVPPEPTERVFINNFTGIALGCPTAQDDTFVPATPDCAP